MPSGKFIPIPRIYEDQFYEKIKYNFKLQVLLCLKGSNYNRQDVLEKIYKLEGYRCHRVAKYRFNWSHLHIKFGDEQKAIAAVDFFNSEDSELTAILVDDLLRDWYYFEVRTNYRPPYSLAIIDVLGHTPQFLDFLTPRILNGILEDFGRPFLLPYTAALAESHVQVLFSSMTEALAACMAFGQWYKEFLRLDQFHYRVRINPSSKEALLIKISGGVPEEAFKLDYFLNQGRIHRPFADGSVRRKEASLKGAKGVFHNKGRPDDPSYEMVKTMKVLGGARSAKPLEMVKRKPVRSSAFETEFRAPVIYFPIITPVISRIAPLPTPDSLHTAVFPRGFGNSVMFQHETPETPVNDGRHQFQALASDGMTGEGLITLDNVQQAARRHPGVEFPPAFLQQMTMPTIPCEVTPDYYGGEALVFDGKNYTI